MFYYLLCILLYQSEILVNTQEAYRVEEHYELLICTEPNSERFLEVRRVTAFKGFPTEQIRNTVLIRLPWGSEAAAGGPPQLRCPECGRPNYWDRFPSFKDW